MIEYVNSSLYDQDGIYKQIEIEYDSGVITNSNLHYEQFELDESLCAETTLKFGSCEANKIFFRVMNPFDSLIDKQIIVKNILNKDINNPFKLGHYKVYSDVPSADRSYRDVTAYDSMYDIINSDVSEWYNNLFTESVTQMSLKEFRTAFISYFGLEQEEIDLINDEMIVTKTIDGSGISGKMVISAICEINGCFGKIGRDGKFKYVYLPEKSAELYPANNLFPSSALIPLGTNAEVISTRQYKGSPTYEDFKVQKISGIQIRMEEDDIGVSVGELNNLYVIQDNFLVYGMSGEALSIIANNILNKVQHIAYRPFTANTIGNPCIEVGDLIRVNTKTIQIDSYVLRRVMKGIQVLTDSYSADGDEYYSQALNSPASEIRKLKGKSNVLKRTLEQTISLISDVENGLKSEIVQTADSLKSEISKTYTTTDNFNSTVNNLQSQIDGAIETFTGDQVPTLDNYPAIEWTNEEKEAHIGDLYIVNSDGGNYSGFYYRFEKNNTDYQWVLLKDSEITKALQDAAEANQKASDLENNLENNYSTTVQMTSAIQQSADSIISTVSKTYETKSDATTTKTELESKISQNASSIALKVSKGNISSEISLEDALITLSGDRIVINSTNFKLSQDGTLEAVNGKFSGDIIANGMIAFKYQDEINGISYDTNIKVGDVIFSVKTDSFLLNENNVYELNEDDVVVSSKLGLLIENDYGLNVNSLVVGNRLQTNIFSASNARINKLIAEDITLCNLIVYNDAEIKGAITSDKTATIKDTIYGGKDILTGGKTAYDDGKTGIRLSASGNIYIQHASSPAILFFTEGETATSGKISVDTNDQMTFSHCEKYIFDGDVLVDGKGIKDSIGHNIIVKRGTTTTSASGNVGLNLDSTKYVLLGAAVSGDGVYRGTVYTNRSGIYGIYVTDNEENIMSNTAVNYVYAYAEA